MTNDDREDTYRGEQEGSRWRGSGPAPGAGPLLGGLLDGLPESGKGTQAREPSPAAPPHNPFRRSFPEPEMPPAQPEPHPAPENAADPAPAPTPPPASGPAAGYQVPGRSEPDQPEPEHSRPASHTRTPAPLAPPMSEPRFNVIPFRSGTRNPGPAQTPQVPLAPQAPQEQRDPHPPEAERPQPPEPAMNPGHADENPAAAEPKQSDTVHAHEAAAPLEAPQHTGPHQRTEPEEPQGKAPALVPAIQAARQALNEQTQDARPKGAEAQSAKAQNPDSRDSETRGAEAKQTAQDTPAAPAAGRPGADDVWNGTDHAFDDAERAAVYRAIRERRDVRAGFRPEPVPADVLTRVLEAAHQAPSVGHTQPWDFLVIDDPELRSRVRDLAQNERDTQAHSRPATRAHAFSGLKVEAVLESPLNVVVTVDPSRGPHSPGRHSKPASYSAALAVENLWLAARAEGLGVGWVAFADEREVARILDLPSHLEVVAYLCVGYVEEFPTEPELSLGGWAKGRPLSWAVHRDRYGRRGLPGQEPTTLLEETITAIGALNARAVEEARDRQDRMTKPQGSLGILEEVSVQLAGLAGECPPPVPEPAAVAVFAGDHGVYAQGVTAWPQEVTAQMVQNFLDGGAVVNAFAEQVGAEVTVIDVGVVGDLPKGSGLLPRKVARGTADFTQGPAMTRDQALQALEGGIEIARDLVSAGNRCLITGDMGIGNTTPAAALVCAFTGADPSVATGRGTGIDDATYERKVEVVRQALKANPVDPEDPIGTLAALGGLEHAALAGFILGGAALRVPVLLDGVIAGSAALAAAAISPESLSACFAGHRSAEPGHAVALEHLGLTPLVDLEMRLGEGSGALLALPLLQGSARALRNVATFDTAGVSTAQ
ncbi:nicotinate-nucleotide--dimethylbenzimidazole phosphoribosyltransferase [Nocardiopsis valliformis]|uniref:nicotinate-nucleotide--dimethylbenzimidazole phosphoribosyltransferase n=1 Tax=Nocardiopsis valliformis TaxID=239974 RepID=UPI00036E3025|nr:nicotinate-nucleotide--dimethylbenzimidazole phosphoribosyltransferase [Nocardiopsis valliformis]